MSEPARIVCIGGGWVALALVRTMQFAIRRRQVEVTVLSRNWYLTTHGLIPEMITGKVSPSEAVSPLAEVLRPARTLLCDVRSIDLNQRTVHAVCPADGSAMAMPFDHLVLGSGSVDDIASGMGEMQNVFSVKTIDACLRLRRRIFELTGSLECDTERVKTVVIVGGNLAGIEIACELAELGRYIAKRDRRASSQLRVLVVERGPRILPELFAQRPDLALYAERRVHDLGVEVRLGAVMDDAGPHCVRLSDSKTLETETVIWCAGNAGSDLLSELPCGHDPRGRVITDRFHRVEGLDRIWAAGDCAAVPHKSGGCAPATALFARFGGWIVGRNILREIAGREPVVDRFGGGGIACTLGARRAVANVFGLAGRGLIAWIGWRSVVWSLFAPGWERKRRLLFDWLQTALRGRRMSDDCVVNLPIGLDAPGE